MKRITIPRGSAEAIDLPVDTGTGDPYPTTTVLRSRVWSGSDGVAPVAAATAAWTAPGLIRASVAEAATAALEPGVYRWQVDLLDGSWRNLAQVELEILPAPGVSAPDHPNPMIEFADLALRAAWIRSVPNQADVAAGFANYRAAATRWLAGLVAQRCWSGGHGSGGYAVGELFLQDGGMVLSEAMRGVLCHYALFLVAQANVAPMAGGETETNFPRLRDYHYREYQRGLTSLRVEITAMPGGPVTYTCDFGRSSLRGWC